MFLGIHDKILEYVNFFYLFTKLNMEHMNNLHPRVGSFHLKEILLINKINIIK